MPVAETRGPHSQEELPQEPAGELRSAGFLTERAERQRKLVGEVPAADRPPGEAGVPAPGRKQTPGSAAVHRPAQRVSDETK